MLENQIDIKKGHRLVHGKYTACSCVGQGSFSAVYSIII